MYVAFFKENITIREEKLGHIWVAAAKGYGEPGTTISAMPYMYALARESFVEVVDKVVACNRIKYYRVNPLLHRLSIKIAEEEMGFEILRNSNGDSTGANSRTSPRRHCVIHCGRDKFNHYSTINQDKHLLSLIFHGGGAYLDDANWKMFELLKILDLEDFGLKILSETIGTTLMELKYLGLRNNYIQKIPRSLGCLKKVEVLDISQNFMVEVSDTILEMRGLYHLHMSDVICPKPLKIDTLEHLETLAYISVYDILGLDEMTMTNLERLGIEEVDENSDLSKLFASLAKSENFSRLTLRGFRFRSMPCLDEVGVLFYLRILKLDGLLSGLPSADNFPPNIKELSLVNSCLDEDPMPVLEKMPWLTYLKLQNAYTGRQMVIGHGGFPSLVVFHIKEFWNLRNLKVAQVGEASSDPNRVKSAGMENLYQLEIYNCPYLDTLRRDVWRIKCLKEFKMVTTKNIATKIRKSGLIPKSMGVDISP